MFRNYIKVAWRNLWRRKGFSCIHLFGLSVAIAAAILLFLTAMFEFSFDNFHKDRNKIGLLYFKEQVKEGVKRSETMPTPLAPALKAELPNLDMITRVANGNITFRHQDKQYDASARFVDKDFLSIFDFPLIKGSKHALDNLEQVVINELIAKTLFGRTDVIGETVDVYLNEEWTSKIIGAISGETPKNSNISFNALLRFEHKPNYLYYQEHWSHNDHIIFVRTKNTLDEHALEQQTQSFMQQYYADAVTEIKRQGVPSDENGEYLSLHVLPLKDYHLNNLGLGNGGSTTFPLMLLVIAGLIIFIASANFINLSIASSLSRNREIATRKTLGSSVQQMLLQLWLESFIILAIALVFGTLLAWILLSQYNANMNYSLQITDIFTGTNVVWIVLAFFTISLIAGGYPAWIAARGNIITSLKGNQGTQSSNSLRNTLTIVQFTIAIVLVIGTLVISTQLNYISNRPLGFNKTEVISIPIGRGINKQEALERMRHELTAVPFVTSVTGTDVNMGMGNDGSLQNSVAGFGYEDKTIYTNYLRVDYDYLQTLDIELLSGRDFSRNFSTDTTAVIINEQMAVKLGGLDILGKTIGLDGGRQVIGIVKDFHFQNLKKTIEPLTMFINPNTFFQVEYIFVRVHTDNLAHSLATVENIWKKVNPNAVNSASYLDENTNNLYKKEHSFGKIIVAGTLIAIVISCVGLFAITLISINRRIKEIGIRKVLGSSVKGVVFLLSKDFLKLVGVAILIASPLAWWIMNRWLDDFAYRIEIEWWVFALAGLFAMGIALITVSSQAIRAALSNPVNSLKNE